MDEHTYSNTPAAVNLYHILDNPEYIKYRHKARRILSKWFQYTSALMKIEDSDVCRGSLDLWRTHFFQKVNEQQFPEVIKTHMRCVMTTQFRRCRTSTPKVKITRIVCSTSFGPVPLNIEMHKENDVWVGVCKQLGTSQFDPKWSKAKQKLVEAIKLHLETLYDVGEIERVLKTKASWVDPVVEYAKEHNCSLAEAATYLVENNKGLMASLDNARKRARAIDNG